MSHININRPDDCFDVRAYTQSGDIFMLTAAGRSLQGSGEKMKVNERLVVGRRIHICISTVTCSHLLTETPYYVLWSLLFLKAD